MVKEDINIINKSDDNQTYAILYGRTVFLVGTTMDVCPFEEEGSCRIISIVKKNNHIFDVNLVSSRDDSDDNEREEGYTHTVDQSNPPGAKDENGNNLNIKIVTIRS